MCETSLADSNATRTMIIPALLGWAYYQGYQWRDRAWLAVVRQSPNQTAYVSFKLLCEQQLNHHINTQAEEQRKKNMISVVMSTFSYTLNNKNKLQKKISPNNVMKSSIQLNHAEGNYLFTDIKSLLIIHLMVIKTELP